MAKVKLIKKLAKKGTKCRPGIKRTGGGKVVIHNTGNASRGANALAHANYLRGGGANNAASWGESVDEKYAYRSIPLKEVAWHAGDGRNGKGNNSYGIEICMNSDGNLSQATDNAAYRAAKVLKHYKVKKALSNVNIFQHNYFSSFGKNCPQMIRAGKPYGWSTFVKKVNVYLDAMWGKDDTPVTGTTTKPSASTKRTKAKKYAIKRKIVKHGTKSADAKRLQKLLKKIGFKGLNGETLAVDGIAGANTVHALKLAQKKYKLTVDGICGSLSWAEIRYRSM